MAVRIVGMYSSDHQLLDRQLCAIVDGEFVPCEDDYKLVAGQSKCNYGKVKCIVVPRGCI